MVLRISFGNCTVCSLLQTVSSLLQNLPFMQIHVDTVTSALVKISI